MDVQSSSKQFGFKKYLDKNYLESLFLSLFIGGLTHPLFPVIAFVFGAKGTRMEYILISAGIFVLHSVMRKWIKFDYLTAAEKISSKEPTLQKWITANDPPLPGTTPKEPTILLRLTLSFVLGFFLLDYLGMIKGNIDSAIFQLLGQLIYAGLLPIFVFLIISQSLYFLGWRGSGEGVLLLFVYIGFGLFSFFFMWDLLNSVYYRMLVMLLFSVPSLWTAKALFLGLSDKEYQYVFGIRR